MLPIGLIVVLVLVVCFFTLRVGYFPGALLLIFVVIFLVLFVVRSLYWRSRRRYWREHFRRNDPIRIVRQRYARGEITKDQFDQMLRDLATQNPRA
jgi:putative membrane protein